MTASSPRPFSFDTVFDGEAVIAPPRPKRAFTPEEVEAARAEAYAEGQASAVARADADAARALQDIAVVVRAAMASLTKIAHEHRSGSAALALAAARKIADAALDRFPEAPAQAALEALTLELEAAPRLVVFSGAEDADRLGRALAETAARAGYEGQIVFRPDPGRPRAAFQFDWGEGRAAYDPEAAAQRVEAALEAALAAEGVHGESGLPPVRES